MADIACLVILSEIHIKSAQNLGGLVSNEYKHLKHLYEEQK